MPTIIHIIAISCIGYLFINAEPSILLKRILGFKEEKYDDYSKIKQFIHRLITCEICSTFWIGIIFGFLLNYRPVDVLFMSSISSVLSGLIKSVINP